MKGRCLEALGDKRPFRVSAGKTVDEYYYLFKIKVWLIHQKTIYDLWIYVITMNLHKIKKLLKIQF